MKQLMLTILLLCFFGFAPAQSVPAELEKLTDQFANKFNPTTFPDEYIVIYVPGSDDPFTKIYDKWKGKTLKASSKVQVVGGFKEIMTPGGHGGGSADGVKKHIAESMVVKYGKSHFPILIDMEGKVAAQLKTNGLTIARVSKKTGNIIDVKDFGTDRKGFFDALTGYFN